MHQSLTQLARHALAAAALIGLTACASTTADSAAPPQASAAAAPAPQGPPPCPPLSGEPTPPSGWSYLEEITALCKADIFKAASPASGPKQQIAINTKQNVGILVHPAVVALKPATTLRWKWNVETLPSKVSEETAPKHDYLSIAVKFDNGQDLTYMWSAELPEGKGFRCPLPGWDTREYHVVVRSGGGDLGRWLSEERNVLADYKKYIGGTAPAKITEVWLIANTIFQQGEGKAHVGDISLGAGKKRVRVF